MASTTATANGHTNVLDGNYKLTTDITFAGSSEDWDLTAANLDANGWKPLGVGSNFKGEFDGQNHTISNIYSNLVNSRNYTGFFGYTGTLSNIKNLGILNQSLTIVDSTPNHVYVGGLVAFSGGVIENCYTTGNAHATGTTFVATGGLVGVNNNITRNSYSTSNAFATATGSGGQASAGGLVGATNQNSEINNCYATGNASGDGDTYVRVGGLVGYTYVNNEINNSYATGNVSGTGDNNVYVGGLSSWNYDNVRINNCYATGDVFITANSTGYIGGLVAGVWGGSTMNNIGDLCEYQNPTQTKCSLYNRKAIQGQWNSAIWNGLTSDSYPTLK